jgi:hypothetical protein
MPDKPEPPGLPFLRKIATFVCGEYGFKHEWKAHKDTFQIYVYCGDKTFSMQFFCSELMDPDSDAYHERAYNFLWDLLYQCKAAQVPPSGKP